MPLMKGREDTPGANTLVENVLQGEDFEFLDQPALISLYAVSDQADTTMTFVVGTERMLDEASVSVESASDRLIFSEDIVLDQEFAPAGARLKLTFRTVTDPVINWAVKVEPIPQGAL